MDNATLSSLLSCIESLQGSIKVLTRWNTEVGEQIAQLHEGDAELRDAILALSNRIDKLGKTNLVRKYDAGGRLIDARLDYP